MDKLNKFKKIKAGIFSILTALFLACFKIVVFALSGSVAILASALDSVLDMFVSTINLVAIREAEKPPDKDHSYGHGKIEAVAGFFQSILIFGSGVYLFYESFLLLINPQPIVHSSYGILVMIVAIFATYFLSRYLHKTAKETNSLVLHSDRLHFITDLWRDLAVIISLVIIYFFNFYRLDSIIGLMISFYIAISSLKIFKESFDILTDRELNSIFRQTIIQEINNFYPEIKSFHGLKTRKSGNEKFVDFDLVFNEDISLKKAHEIAEKLTQKIKNKIDNIKVMIHFDTYDDSKKDD